MLINKAFILILVIATFSKLSQADDLKAEPLDLEDSITFTIILGNGTRVVSGFEENGITNKGCNSSEKWAIIVHGWTESIDAPWMNDTIGNFTKYRGGCIMVMDYKNHSFDYILLTLKFYKIAEVLEKKLNQFKSEGFDFDLGYMFGFSFGARLVTYAGQQMNGEIGLIDTCDPAGPFFDYTSKVVNASSAAKNVQCINTSVDRGTSFYDCDQNWLMGECGRYQPAHIEKDYHRNHGLCIKFFNSAFENPFYAEEDFSNCYWIEGKATEYPENFRMGYMEKRKSKVKGVLFARTTEEYPFNYYHGA